MDKHDVSVVIQAGGQSSRMGQDKGLVTLGDRLMIEHVLEKVEHLGDEVFITTNNRAGYSYFGFRLVPDVQTPGSGSLPGLLTALTAATGQFVVVVGCDMPFLNTQLLQFQLELAFTKNMDLVVPRWDNHLQMFHAVYKRETCKPAVEHALADNQLKMSSLLPGVQVYKLEKEEIGRYSPDGLSFFNVNTPEELAKAEEIWASLYSEG